MPGHRHTLKSELNEYSCLHKLCFTSANSRQTFSQNAHEVDQRSLSYCGTWQCMVSSPHSHYQPCSLNITICLIVSSKFPFPHSLPPLFLQDHSSFPTVSSVLRILTHMAGLDDFARLRGSPVPEWPRCVLITPSSAQPKALSTSGLLLLRDKSLLTCYFLHVLETITT